MDCDWGVTLLRGRCADVLFFLGILSKLTLVGDPTFAGPTCTMVASAGGSRDTAVWAGGGLLCVGGTE